jgi:hypothetical protein
MQRDTSVNMAKLFLATYKPPEKCATIIRDEFPTTGRATVTNAIQQMIDAICRHGKLPPL